MWTLKNVKRGTFRSFIPRGLFIVGFVRRGVSFVWRGVLQTPCESVCIDKFCATSSLAPVSHHCLCEIAWILLCMCACCNSFFWPAVHARACVYARPPSLSVCMCAIFSPTHCLCGNFSRVLLVLHRLDYFSLHVHILSCQQYFACGYESTCFALPLFVGVCVLHSLSNLCVLVESLAADISFWFFISTRAFAFSISVQVYVCVCVLGFLLWWEWVPLWNDAKFLGRWPINHFQFLNGGGCVCLCSGMWIVLSHVCLCVWCRCVDY